MQLSRWIKKIGKDIERWSLLWEKFSLDWVYLFLGLVLGGIMVFASPPFAGVPDEHAHYWKAWSIAEGYLWCTGQDEIPKTAQTLPDAIKPVAYEGIKEKKIVVGRLQQFLFEKETNEKAVIGGANCPSTPFGYVSQVVGFRLGSALGMSALMDVYLGRFLNMVLATLFVFFAIRIIPFGKIIILIVGLLPLTIQQFASLSYDALQISLALLFIAYVLHLSFSKKGIITRREIFFLLLLSLVGLNIKLGYFPLALLVWLLPRARFESRRKQYIFQGLFLFSNIGFFLLLRQVFQDIAMPVHTNPSEQLQFVLYAPVHFLNVVFETVYSSGLVNYIAGILYRSGWGSPVPHLLLMGIFFWIIFLLRSEKESIPFTARQRLIISGAFLANFFLLYLALYMGWTKVGADKVSGVQGRYLVALLPLFIFLFYSGTGSWNFKWVQRRRNGIIILGSLVIFSWIFINIYQNYYLKEKPGPTVYERYLEDK